MLDDPFDRAVAGAHATRKAARRRGLRWMLVTMVLGLGLGVLMVWLVVSFTGLSSPRHDRQTTLDRALPWILWGLIVVMLARALRMRSLRISPLDGVDRGTRRRVHRAILRRRAMADPRLAALALDTTAAFRPLGWPLAIFWLAMAASSGERLVRHASARPLLDGLILVLATGLAVYFVLFAHRGPKADQANRAFLNSQTVQEL